MFKKVMEIPDNLIIRYYELATDEHPNEIEKIKEMLDNNVNPRDIKYNLAKTIVSLYHTREELEKAVNFYDTAFSKKAIPDDIPELLIENGMETILDIIPKLKEMSYVKSKNEFFKACKSRWGSVKW